MKKISPFLASAFVAAAIAFAPLAATAAEGIAPPKVTWPHDGMTGTYDKAALQRGFQIYKEVCAACHGMNLLSYRNLAGLGYTEAEIKAIAAEYTVIDGPNDEGEMFERPARPSDRFKNPFANPQAAAAANGAVPPDLSLIVKGRHRGADYIHALLTGYKDAPADADVPPGKHWNKYYPGHVISMAPPLADGQVTYADGRTASLDEAAKDVTQFLTWAGEPHMEARKHTGMKVLLFMLIFAGIMFAAKRKVWADVH